MSRFETSESTSQEESIITSDLSKGEMVYFLIGLAFPSILTNSRPLGTFSGSFSIIAPLWYIFFGYYYDLGELVIDSMDFYPAFYPHIFGGWLEPFGPMYLTLGVAQIWTLWRFRTKGIGERAAILMLFLNFVPPVFLGTVSILHVSRQGPTAILDLVPLPVLPIICLFIFRRWKASSRS